MKYIRHSATAINATSEQSARADQTSPSGTTVDCTAARFVTVLAIDAAIEIEIGSVAGDPPTPGTGSMVIPAGTSQSFFLTRASAADPPKIKVKGGNVAISWILER